MPLPVSALPAIVVIPRVARQLASASAASPRSLRKAPSRRGPKRSLCLSAHCCCHPGRPRVFPVPCTITILKSVFTEKTKTKTTTKTVFNKLRLLCPVHAQGHRRGALFGRYGSHDCDPASDARFWVHCTARAHRRVHSCRGKGRAKGGAHTAF